MLSHDNTIFECHSVFLKTAKQGLVCQFTMPDVQKCHEQAMEGHRCRGVPAFLKGAEQERILSYLPLSHIAGMTVDITVPCFLTANSPAWATCLSIHLTLLSVASGTGKLRSRSTLPGLTTSRLAASRTGCVLLDLLPCWRCRWFGRSALDGKDVRSASETMRKACWLWVDSKDCGQAASFGSRQLWCLAFQRGVEGKSLHWLDHPITLGMFGIHVALSASPCVSVELAEA